MNFRNVDIEQVVELLESANHYKTARLAQYHIVRRGDSLPDQLEFYQYLNGIVKVKVQRS